MLEAGAPFSVLKLTLLITVIIILKCCLIICVHHQQIKLIIRIGRISTCIHAQIAVCLVGSVISTVIH